ncbi:hypothetical protein [Streptomyces cyaneogriseus]|uniref:hypothetical protein n=1 Tax=Streptomyces cyaneogriseus TaxID=68192 RepID=UPI0013311678|nr:hypothetical protein [Streptomyces cyaneogriseus]
MDDPRLGPVQVIAVGAPADRFRPVPGPSGQCAAEQGVPHGGVVVGVRFAELVPKALEKRSYERELRS